MSNRQQIRLGLVGYGEIGSGLAFGLRREGLASITAYDTGADHGPFASLIRTRAADASTALVGSPAELAASADVILVAVPGSECRAAAAAIAPHLRSHHIYVDLGSATPVVKQQAFMPLASSGASLADGAIMSSPLIDGHRLEILASGPAAPALVAAVQPWTMNVTAVGPKVGAASAIKILRSVVTKGLEALLVECLLATESYGISEDVLQSLGRFLDPRPFTGMANFLVTTDAIHAARRAEEAAMCAEALQDAGVEPTMTRATVARLNGSAALRLKESFGGIVPERYDTVIHAMQSRMRAAR